MSKSWKQRYIAGLAIFEFELNGLSLVLNLVACKTDHVCFEIYLLPEQVSQFVIAHASEQGNHEERVMVRMAYREKGNQLKTAVNANFLFFVALEALVDRGSDESLWLQSTIEEETT